MRERLHNQLSDLLAEIHDYLDDRADVDTSDGTPTANRELRLLEILLAAPERIFSKAQLCDRLFSYAESVTDNAIEVYVGRLRRKLDGSGARIDTVRGVGYRLTAE